MNIVYRRENSNWLASDVLDKSNTYWRSVARRIFARFQDVTLLEIVRSGCKTDSALLRLSLIHISEPTRRHHVSRMPSSA